jgi:hypothetical protein
LLGAHDRNASHKKGKSIMRESTNTTPNSGTEPINSGTGTNDTELLAKLNEAVAAANEAEKSVATAQAELVSRSKAVGLLLLEAKKLHPSVKGFEAFLERVDSLKLSRAYDLMRLAGGRVTDEKLKKDARERQQKSRANRKELPRSAPKKLRKPEQDSVTVTESAEISIEQRRAENAELDLSAEEKAAKASERALAEFTVACRTWLPKITEESDRQKARLTSGKPKAKAA